MKDTHKVMLEAEKAYEGCLLLDPSLGGTKWLKINLDDSGFQYSFLKPQEIYIISDEEIKDDDWVLLNYPNGKRISKASKNAFNNGKFFNAENETHNNGHGKIIKTTNKALIEDGVEMLDFEFINEYITKFNKGEIHYEVETLNTKTFTYEQVKELFIKKFSSMMPEEEELKDFEMKEYNAKTIVDAIEFGMKKQEQHERAVYLRAIINLDEFLNK